MMTFDALRRLDGILLRAVAGVSFFFRRRERVSAAEAPWNILCIKLWGIGNLTLLFPLLSSLKKKHPQAQITLLTFGTNRDFAACCPAVDRVEEFPLSTNLFRIVRDWFICLRRTRKMGYSMIVNCETHNSASGLFVFLADAPLRIGIDSQGEGIFYNRIVVDNGTAHLSGLYRRLFAHVGVDDADTYPSFARSPLARQHVSDLLRREGTEQYVCIHAGTSSNGLCKRYPPRHVSLLADSIVQKLRVRVIFVGDGSERALDEAIRSQMEFSSGALNWAGRLTIREFIELVRGCRLLIGNDSGPLHIASSLGVDVAAFFGPTDPRRFGPLRENSLVLYQNKACSPCRGNRRIARACPSNEACLDFDPREVFKKIEEKFFHESVIRVYQECRFL